MISVAAAAPAPTPVGEVDPWVAAAWAPLAVDDGQLTLARELARRMIEAPETRFDGWRVWLRVAQLGGWGAVAEAEAKASPHPEALAASVWWDATQGRAAELPPGRPEIERAAVAAAAGQWAAVAAVAAGDDPALMALRLRALGEIDDVRRQRQEALQWLERHPERPEVIAGLWSSSPAPEPRLRERLLATMRARVDGDVDLRWVLLALHTAREAGDDALAARLVARVPALEVAGRTFPPPIHRRPWGRPMQRAIGQALASHETPTFPTVSAAERVGVAESLAKELRQRGRLEDALAAWRSAEAAPGAPAWEVSLGIGEVAEALGDDVAAEQAYREALGLTVAPWEADPCGLALVERVDAADRIIAAAGGGARPDALAAAVRGDVGPWIAATEDSFLRGCLQVVDGVSSAWKGIHPPAAARMLPARFADARAAVAPSRPKAASTPTLPEVGDRFPDLPLPLQPESTQVSALRGAPVIFSVWASWCAPCMKELPQLDAVIGELRANGVAVHAVALSVDDDPRAYERAAQRLRLQHWSIGRSPKASTALGATSLPVTWLIGADGRVLTRHLGYDPQLAALLGAQLSAGGPR